MKTIFEFIFDIALVVLIQASVLIPLTILAFFVRQWIIRWIRGFRYRKKKKLLDKFGMDLFQIPESLHNLTPYAEEFGIVDHQDRMKYQEGVTIDNKQAFMRAIRGKEDEILQWLKSVYPYYSKEAVAFAFMLKSMSEMNLLVDYQISSEPGIVVHQYAASHLPMTRMLYYQQRPKNRAEKFVYDLFSNVIATIIFPVFYFLIAKAWSVFSSNEESVVAFGIICTLAFLLSLSTFKSASWIIKGFWNHLAYR